MKNKRHVVEAIAIAIFLVCMLIVWFNTTLHSKPLKVNEYEKFRSVSVIAEDTNYIDWEDKFDTSYVDKVTGCIVFTQK